jgi:hypothetical protein
MQVAQNGQMPGGNRPAQGFMVKAGYVATTLMQKARNVHVPVRRSLAQGRVIIEPDVRS